MTEVEFQRSETTPRDGVLVIGYLTGIGSRPLIRVTASVSGEEVASRTLTSRQQVHDEVDAWLDHFKTT